MKTIYKMKNYIINDYEKKTENATSFKPKKKDKAIRRENMNKMFSSHTLTQTPNYI